MTKIHPAIAEHAMEENERLRGLLTQALEFTESNTCGGPDVAQLIAEMRAALSRQADPTDTFTAVDMATAAAQGFRDGQAAVEQAPAQDEREAPEVVAVLYKSGDVLTAEECGIALEVCAKVETPLMTVAQHERIVTSLTRPAQTDPQSEFGDAYQGAREDLAIWKRRALEAEQKVRQQEQIIDHLTLEAQGETRMGEPVIPQTAPQPEQTALSAVTAERDRLREDRDSQQRVCIAEMEKANQLRAEVEALRVALHGIASVNPAERCIEWAKSYASDGLKGEGSEPYARWLDTFKEAETLRALLNKALPVVEAHAGASHMLDGFRPARNKWDDLVDGIRAAMSAKEA